MRSARPRDLPVIVRVHRAAFPGFFMTRVGPTFLRRYYALVLDHPAGLLLVEDAPAPRGFVAGYLDPAAFYRAMRRRGLSLGAAALLGLLRDPLLLPRVTGNVARVQRHASWPPERRADAAELASIGVDPEARSRGLGARLVRAFESRAAAAGAAAVELTTEPFGNDRTNLFYARLGYELVRTFEDRSGRSMNLYRRSL